MESITINLKKWKFIIMAMYITKALISQNTGLNILLNISEQLISQKNLYD